MALFECKTHGPTYPDYICPHIAQAVDAMRPLAYFFVLGQLNMPFCVCEDCLRLDAAAIEAQTKARCGLHFAEWSSSLLGIRVDTYLALERIRQAKPGIGETLESLRTHVRKV